MKTKILFLFALIFSMNIAVIQSQTDENGKKPKNQVGFSAGNTSGVGFSYRYWPGKCGLQITATPPWLEDGKLSYFNGGVSFLFNLIEVPKAKFYMYSAASYVSRGRGYMGGYDEEINAGVGLGYDIFAGKNIGFNFQGGYGLFDFQHGVNTGVAVEAGIYFKFYGNK